MIEFNVGDKILKTTKRLWTNDSGKQTTETTVYEGVVTEVVEGLRAEWEAIKEISCDNPAPFHNDHLITGGGFSLRYIEKTGVVLA
tara:strand:- start:57 stop:314 length:258 start_codon:yes stop_codon:yes gene_type:complete